MSTGPGGPLLLCYDGSEHAERAIRHAAALMRTRDAVVLHVPHRGSTGDVAEAGCRIARDAGLKPTSAVEGGSGRIAITILEEAHSRGAAAIVVGSRGRGATASTVLGSVSSELVHRSDVPVLVTRQTTAAEPPPSEPVFICYDGSGIARQAIATAGSLLAGRAALVASFLPPVDEVVMLRETLPWPAGPEMQERLARLDRAEAEAPLEAAAEGADAAMAAGFAPRPVDTPGEGVAWKRLRDAAIREEAACIVVGHRHTAMHLGSTAYGLVHHADRPVLVAPAASSS